MITGYSAELNLYKATPIRFIVSPFPPAHTRITASIFHYPCIKHINLYCNNEKIIMDINEPPARISPACERRNKEFNWSGLKHVLYLQNKDNKKKNTKKNHEKKNTKKNYEKKNSKKNHEKKNSKKNHEKKNSKKNHEKKNTKKNHEKKNSKKNHEKKNSKKNHEKKNNFVRKKYDITLLHAFRKCFITDSV